MVVENFIVFALLKCLKLQFLEETGSPWLKKIIHHGWKNGGNAETLFLQLKEQNSRLFPGIPGHDLNSRLFPGIPEIPES